MTENKYAYQISNLQFKYPGAQGKESGEGSLDIADLRIERGQVTVIRGHNGSGKTTLLKLLCGLLSPGEGAIATPDGLKAVLVQQEPYLFHGTVRQNLTAPLRFQGKKGNRDEWAAEKLKLVGLAGFDKRKARELSGGEKKRVAIARALMAGTDVLLLDEPDANVDAATSAELERLIRSLKEKGMTVILCSHHKSFAYRTSDRIIDLYKGSPADHDENVFKGIYDYEDAVHSRFISGDTVFTCPSRQDRFTTAVIPAENISLTREKTRSGKDNCLKAVLKSIRPYKEGRFTLTLDCGSFPMKVRMSSSEMALHGYRPEEELQLVFSPSAVRLY